MPADKPLAIVLGGTHPHAVLVERLKGRGYHVLLVDHLESPPAARVADEHVRVSTVATDDVLELAKARSARLVIATCVDRANVTAAYVSEKLGLPAAYSSATAARIANKLGMKRQLTACGIPTAPFTALRSPDEVPSLSLAYPVVVKPIDTGGSKGVRKASNAGELRIAIDEAFRVTRASEVLVEAFVEGVEVSADCLVHEGEPRLLALRRKYVLAGQDGAVLCNYASVCPAAVSPLAHEAILDAMRRIARGFGLRATPMLAQFIVDGDRVQVIEFAPRVGGGTNHRQVLLGSGVDIVDATIDCWLQRPRSPSIARQRGFLATNHLYTHPGRFGEIRGAQALVEVGVVAELYVHKARGARIGTTLAASDRAASFIVRGNDGEALLRRTHEAMQRLDVVDVEGHSMLRRNLYLKAL